VDDLRTVAELAGVGALPDRARKLMLDDCTGAYGDCVERIGDWRHVPVGSAAAYPTPPAAQRYAAAATSPCPIHGIEN